MSERVPRIRFEGYEDEWEEKPAENLFFETCDKGHPNLPVLSATQTQGMVLRDDSGKFVFHAKENEETYKRVLPGQFVIHLRSFQGGFAHSEVEGITSPAYTVFGLADELQQDDRFWKQIFSSSEFVERLSLVTYGIRDGRSISYQEFLTLSFCFPCKNEQAQIADFLDCLDKLIAKREEGLQKLRAIKSALLQQMFPRVGGTEPELRFEGFTEPWQRCRFDSFFKPAGRNNTLSRASLNESDGEVQDIHYGDILIKFGSIVDVDKDEIPFVTGAKKSDFSSSALKNGDIVFADTAEDETAGKAVEIVNATESCIVPGLHTMAFRPCKKMASGYLGYYLNSPVFHSQLLPYLQGIKVLSINREALESTAIIFPPSIEEQRQIGALFTRLDSLITLRRQELDKLGQVKKALLLTMFV